MNEERLQKVIAAAGVASRRHAEEMITQGRVTVNDHVVRVLGVKVTPEDKVSVDGVPLTREKKQYFLFYKPRGVITAVSDDKGRKVVTDFFEEVQERLYPVGRLDYDTSGALIMTNDGDFANMMMHPKFNIDKQYVAKVKGVPQGVELMPLRQGITIEGRKLAKAKAKVLSRDRTKQTAIVELTIHQGLNHQVKKMLKAVGYPVLKLSRVAFGPLTLDGLQPGDYRKLSHHEVHALKGEAGN
ncbi:pseudouridine synthase [Lacticaseibacillus songhuajiangensis]|uniref:pseudouridine synthase n=1 Tax=Lacticaseibacillus songhuajiangensis TaxID=1296539 RepID=UPI000F7A9745|nr:pseudouridine synthase [Lacticaseibacillus songhuajiangensis]MCI1284197.1 rRNA pseudouridine synthase [Lacticaseibacillus songhuajiangensis]